jgi:hypothetical protein
MSRPEACGGFSNETWVRPRPAGAKTARITRDAEAAEAMSAIALGCAALQHQEHRSSERLALIESAAFRRSAARQPSSRRTHNGA